MEPAMTLESITARVQAEIAAALRVPAERVPPGARLDASELGIDSLGLIKLSVRLEEIFEVTMPDLAAEPEAVVSVRDVAAMIARQLEAREGGRR